MKIFLARGGSLLRDVTEGARRLCGDSGELSREAAEELIRAVGEEYSGGVLTAAPDGVFEGWGIGSDGSFLRPSPPAGWRYDESTGTFYRAGDGSDVTDERKG